MFPTKQQSRSYSGCQRLQARCSTGLPTEDCDDDDEAISTLNATSAAGQTVTFARRDDGYTVTSGDVTARIVSTDHLTANGMIHVIHTVLTDVQAVSPSAAASVASCAATAEPPSHAGVEGGGSQSGSSDNDSANNEVDSIADITNLCQLWTVHYGLRDCCRSATSRLSSSAFVASYPFSWPLRGASAWIGRIDAGRCHVERRLQIGFANVEVRSNQHDSIQYSLIQCSLIL